MRNAAIDHAMAPASGDASHCLSSKRTGRGDAIPYSSQGDTGVAGGGSFRPETSALFPRMEPCWAQVRSRSRASRPELCPMGPV